MANTATSKLPPTSRPPSTVPAPQDNHGPKKSKAKKATDPVNTTKQIEDTIAALERNRAGEKDQELEIGQSPSPPFVTLIKSLGSPFNC